MSENAKEPVTSYAEAVDNAVRFQIYLRENEILQSKLSQYRQWYYIPEKDIFAPSKFIGYKNNTYHSESAHPGDGLITEAALSHFFRKINSLQQQTDIYISDLYNRLASILQQYGKKLNKKAVIHIPKEKISK